MESEKEGVHGDHDVHFVQQILDASVRINIYKEMLSSSKDYFSSRALVKSYVNAINVCKERGQVRTCALVVWNPTWSAMLSDAHKISEEVLKKCISTVQFMHTEALRKTQDDVLHMLPSCFPDKRLNVIQFSKRNVPYSTLLMRHDNIRHSECWTNRYLHGSADYITLRYDPPWNEIYLHGSQKIGLIGPNEVAAMSSLFKTKWKDFDTDLCKTMASEKEMQVIHFCKKGSFVAHVFIY